MDILWSLGLVIVVLVALNHMAGGRASSILGPAAGIVTRLLSMAVRAVMNLAGAIFKVSIGTMKLPKPRSGSDSGRGGRPTPPRWKD
jgi:hypothetical protein